MFVQVWNRRTMSNGHIICTMIDLFLFAVSVGKQNEWFCKTLKKAWLRFKFSTLQLLSFRLAPSIHLAAACRICRNCFNMFQSHFDRPRIYQSALDYAIARELHISTPISVLCGPKVHLSAKISASGPNSRGGKALSCKESKVLGRLKMFVTSKVLGAVTKPQNVSESSAPLSNCAPVSNNIKQHACQDFLLPLVALESLSATFPLSFSFHSAFEAKTRITTAGSRNLSPLHVTFLPLRLSITLNQGLHTVSICKGRQRFWQQHCHA